MSGTNQHHKSHAALTQKLKAYASALGCDLVGVAPVRAFQELDFFPEWLAAGYAGEMEYLQRQLPKRLDPCQILPDAKSVVVIGVNYHSDHPLSTALEDDERGWISRYAWGEDYHHMLAEKLEKLDAFLRNEAAPDYQSKYYADTGPVLDRVFAKYAGLGWFGKNTNLINQRMGSWFFIGELITNLVLEIDAPPPDRCGTCRRCLDACPTNAFVAPYVLDSKRCISYLSIELRGAIPEELRPDMGHHVFGCDICQDVCPWNRKAPVTKEPAFMPRENMFAPALAELAELDEPAFRARFRRSPLKRAKWRGFMRNVLVAMGNSGQKQYRRIIVRFLGHTDGMLAETAAWADQRLQSCSDRETRRSPHLSAEEVAVYGHTKI
ncbi:MAG: tRNA epoxyqueuosine(34) reductase QueG [bacterium]